MKKSKLLGFLILLLFPMFVFADVSVPEIKEYEVVVVNPDGVNLENQQGRKINIPCDTKLTVYYEFYDKETGITYGSVEYQGVYGDINLKDVKLLSKKLTKKDARKLSKAEERYVIDDDVYLYNGPSRIYGKVDGEKKIPVGEKVTYEYYIEAWSYVEYDGVSGWIYTNSPSEENSLAMIAPENNNKVLLTKNVKKLYVNPKREETVNVNIPKGTELEYQYSYMALRSQYVYVEYKDTKGWIFIDEEIDAEPDALIECECYKGMVLEDKINIYSDFLDKKSKTDKTLTKGEKVSVIYQYYSDGLEVWYYVKNDNKKGWIYTERNDDFKFQIAFGIAYEYKVNEDVKVYEYPDLESKLVGEFKKGDLVDGFYEYQEYTGEHDKWRYVKNDKVEGWVNNKAISLTDKEGKELCAVSNKNELVPKEEKKEEPEEPKEKQHMSTMMKAIICVVGAMVLALVVIVTIVLINKKSKIGKL